MARNADRFILEGQAHLAVMYGHRRDEQSVACEPLVRRKAPDLPGTGSDRSRANQEVKSASLAAAFGKQRRWEKVWRETRRGFCRVDKRSGKILSVGS